MKVDGRQLLTTLSTYGSKLDEDIMFSWLDKIPCVMGYKGIGVDLYIELKEGEIDDESLRELISLFFRYQLDLFQLRKFETKRNKKWFNNAKAYWHPYVFKDKTPVPLFGIDDVKWWGEIKARIKKYDG
jgi:hypothetical protein